MRRATSLLFAFILLATPAAAQFVPDEEGPGASESAAFLALTLTPVGAFSDVVSVRSDMKGGIGLRFLLGQIDEEGDITRRSFGVGVEIPVGTATFGFTGGLQDVACPDDENYGFFTLEYDCAHALMGGASFDVPLVTSTLGDQGAGVTLGLQMTAGYARGPELIGATLDDGAGTRESFSAGGSGLSATIGVPLSLVARSGNLRVVPHITPRFGWGQMTLKYEDSADPSLNTENTESGTRFMLGGGVAVYLEGGVGFSLGFQKTFIEDGTAAIGFGVTWAR